MVGGAQAPGQTELYKTLYQRKKSQLEADTELLLPLRGGLTKSVLQTPLPSLAFPSTSAIPY